ncbi:MULTISPECIES: hypothetical protein [unclassified Halomonas]|uniref:hypothetical protein n=1 Tax=unclassified Halomonas TaxID=2609666 RepID=UPI00209F93BE|nr:MULTISPECIES: hypothetical protein [unclassified Halomonas]MCP1314162.1 hypothetical protein [Halomonas sp. 707D7]MCP1326572.1 hypothetical protein [Halomonas sp. 707D4]
MTIFNLPRVEGDAPISTATETLCLTPDQAQSQQGVVQALWGEIACDDIEIATATVGRGCRWPVAKAKAPSVPSIR